MIDPFADAPPHPLVLRAAQAVQAELQGRNPVPREGKMYGVLVVRTREGMIGYLKAFSGQLEGRWDVAGFVPPVFDAAVREAFELEGAREVQRLLALAEDLAAEPARRALARDLALAREAHEQQRRALSERHARARAERNAQRVRLQVDGDEAALYALAQQSRADKAEAKRLQKVQEVALRPLLESWQRSERRLQASVRLRRLLCRRLMDRIHDAYQLENALGETRSLRQLFAPATPPAGAADCAAPKLLAFAHRHRLAPLALGEFWWGPPPSGGGRLQGAWYPPCRGKCFPILPFMLSGTRVLAQASRRAPSPPLAIVYEDRFLLVVDKPPGLLSVPGRGAGHTPSVSDLLQDLMGKGVALVHRLDQDTSGLLVAAKSQVIYVALQRQFLARQVAKTYVALVAASVVRDFGVIELPLRLDVMDRPRQVVDPEFGKWARTSFEVVERRGSETLVRLFPYTGRTHQLRVHCAHPAGLAAPIVGDRLYGKPGPRLFLHARGLGFRHPVTGRALHFDAPPAF